MLLKKIIFYLVFINLNQLVFAISQSEAESMLYRNCIKKSTSNIDMSTTTNFCRCYSKGATKAMISLSGDDYNKKLSEISEACKIRYVDGKGI